MQNLKVQTHQVLSKVLQQLSKQRQEDEKNKLSNPQNQQLPIKCKQLIDLFSHSLDPKQKMLLEITLANDMQQQMNVQSFREKITKTINQLSMDNNEFNIPVSQMPKALINMNESNMKGIVKPKKTSQGKKTEPTVESHPEYFRVDYEICHKLYQHYKILPLGMPKTGVMNFQQNQHLKNSMNYHKILQIFKDAKLDLQINQKLLILRAIKKFSFNQNFISSQQFIKIFKVIVHGLGYKQQTFQQFVKKKEFNKETNKQSRVSGQKTRKNYRFKTDNSLLQHQSSNNNRTRNLHDLSLADNRKIIQNKKKGSSNKMPLNDSIGNPSYLVKAMESQKVSKITWQSLFNMKQTSMHNFIVIPNFIRNANIDDL